MSLELRVLLADDHPTVRAGLRALLSQMPGIVAVGEAGDGRQALRLMRTLVPDVAVLDIGMPGLNGLETAARARRLRIEPQPKVVILSMHAAEAYVRAALEAGAHAYVLKSADIEDLERAIRTVAKGKRYFGAGLPPLEASAEPPPRAKLTSRQREVLQLVAEGLGTRAIAELLHLSAKTVESHRAELMRRLDIHDIAGLTRYAVREHLVQE